MLTDAKIIDALIEREGGFVDHPADRGGPTKFGITQRTLSRWRGRAASIAEVRELTEADAREIYRADYVRRPGFADIQDAALRGLLVDYGVHSGPRTAAMSLQMALGVAVDGAIGPQTLGALRGQRGAVVYRRVLAERFRRLGRIITDDHDQAAFAAGWMNRVAEFLEGDG